MSVYNARPYVRDAVQSILDQSLSSFEFIIIDDGSIDGSGELLERMQRDDARIRLVRRENRGLIASLNEGLRLVTTPFVARMDADDRSLPQRLEVLERFLLTHPDAAAVSSGFVIADQRGREMIEVQRPTEDHEIQGAMIRGISLLAHAAAMIRVDALRQVGGYRESAAYVEDLDLWLRLGEMGRLYNVRDVLYVIREHAMSVCSQKQSEQDRNARQVVAEACQRRGVAYLYERQMARPVGPDARYHLHLKHGWWMQRVGKWGPAVEYGLRCTLSRPLRRESWRLLLCACRGAMGM
jgi:glycosyltransferase involved in cell wall biosynthesis